MLCQIKTFWNSISLFKVDKRYTKTTSRNCFQVVISNVKNIVHARLQLLILTLQKHVPVWLMYLWYKSVNWFAEQIYEKKFIYKGNFARYLLIQ